VEKSKTEHREYQRFDSFVGVHYKHRDGKKEEDGLTGDLSRNGLKLFTDEKLQVGEELDLSVLVPDDPKAINVAGEVIWCRTSREKTSKYDIGVKFIGLSAVDKFRVLDYAYNNWLEDKVDELGTYDPELQPEKK